MKKNIISLAVVFICMSCNAQSPIFGFNEIPATIPAGSYIKDTHNILNKFEGTWVFSNSNSVFTITLQKASMVSGATYYTDELRGQYSFIQDNVTIVDTYDQNGENSKIDGAMVWSDNLNKVTVYFRDPERPKTSYEVTLTYSNTNGNEKLNWQLYITGVSYVMEGEELPQQDYRVPIDCELTKQ